jgi:para-nitrobenzyl esterase
MVWIPGGGNFGVASGQGVNNGQNLARHGVVVVTINYRLGLFGFFAHPELTRESPHHASGNQGILDQIAALRWVRQNIARFGGDPANVTIFGESAGSLDVSVLMTSPLSKGLFRHVIGESGAVILVGDPLTLVQAEKQGESFAQQWNIGDASLKGMRAVPAAGILKKEPDYLQSPPPNLGITIDGYVFPRRPADVFAAGQEHPVDLLLGNNSRERIPGTTPPSDLTKAVEDTYGPIAKQALAIYVGAADPLYGMPADQWATDTSFRCSAVLQLMWHAAAGNAAFEFQFDRTPPGPWVQPITRTWNMCSIHSGRGHQLRHHTMTPSTRPFPMPCSNTGPTSLKLVIPAEASFRSGPNSILSRGRTWNSQAQAR